MRFLTDSECDAWVSRLLTRDHSANSISVQLPPESGRLLFFARHVAQEITFRERCLLRMKEWDIWGSDNNWHLYYRLRMSYGDRMLIEDAPGHLFLDYEVEDLATFLHVAMLFGWDAELKPQADYVSAFLSHDGFLDLYSDNQNLLTEFRTFFEDAKLNVRSRP